MYGAGVQEMQPQAFNQIDKQAGPGRSPASFEAERSRLSSEARQPSAKRRSSQLVYILNEDGPGKEGDLR